jgi:hypothetical protein
MATTLLATFFFAPVPAGSQPQERAPEKLSNDKPEWDPSSAAFVIEFSATASLANRAVDEGYVLDTTLVIRDLSGEVVDVLRDLQPVERLESPDADRGGMVPLQPQVIVWPGWTPGIFRIQVTTELTTAQGEAVPVFGYTGATNSYRLFVS